MLKLERFFQFNKSIIHSYKKHTLNVTLKRIKSQTTCINNYCDVTFSCQNNNKSGVHDHNIKGERFQIYVRDSKNITLKHHYNNYESNIYNWFDKL